jgi:hypothetical protein
MLSDARKRAKARGLPFGLTRKWLSNILDNGVCEKTGISFVFDTPHHPFTPSIDQIEPSCGYVHGNVRVVVWAYNVAKNNWTDDVVLQIARALVKRSRR